MIINILFTKDEVQTIKRALIYFANNVASASEHHLTKPLASFMEKLDN